MSKVTKNNQPSKLDYVDQEVNSKVMQFISTDGYSTDVNENDVLSFIENNNMNVSYEGEGLTCDPYGTEVEVITDASVYLENNFDYVTQAYYEQVIAMKGGLENAA